MTRRQPGPVRWRARLLRALLAVAILLLSGSAAAESRSSINLGAIADDYYWALQDRLVRPNFSSRANKAWLAKLSGFQKRLRHIKTANLGSQARITYRMLEKDLAFQRDYVAKGWIGRDINGTESPAQSVAEWTDTSRLRNANDWKWTIVTLRNSERFMSSYITLLDQGLKDGKPQPREVVQSAISSLKILTSTSAAKNPFLQMEKALETSMKGKPQLPELRRQLREVLRKQVLPSHKRLVTFLEKTYLPRAGKLGTDRAAYLYQMKRHLGPNHPSPEHLHVWGKREVKRLKAELFKTAKQINPEAKSLSSFMTGLANRRDNRYQSPGELIGDTQREIVRSRELVRRQVPVPRSEIDVRPVASHQEATLAAQYYATGEGKGRMEVNTGRLLGSQRKTDLATLVTHEVFGGHHLAAMYAQKQGDVLPQYRTEAADTTFDEGWGLYAEQLRDEQGGFTPKERVGYLVNHLWRASRLVVDTGLHTGEMTPAQARKFFKQNAFVTEDAAATEIQRYMDWPAQALAYYVGKREILRIRRDVKRILGKQFDIRKFHAKMLSMGSVPPGELRGAMLSWARRRHGQLESRAVKKKIIRNLRGPKRDASRARAAQAKQGRAKPGRARATSPGRAGQRRAATRVVKPKRAR